VKVGIRKGDAAVLCLVELTGQPVEYVKEPSKKKADQAGKSENPAKKVKKAKE
jgi:hypothetical protein